MSPKGDVLCFVTINYATGSTGNTFLKKWHDTFTGWYLHMHPVADLLRVVIPVWEHGSGLRHLHSGFELEQGTLASTGSPGASREALKKDYVDTGDSTVTRAVTPASSKMSFSWIWLKYRNEAVVNLFYGVISPWCRQTTLQIKEES